MLVLLVRVLGHVAISSFPLDFKKSVLLEFWWEALRPAFPGGVKSN
jgi:hypothetical protein